MMNQLKGHGCEWAMHSKPRRKVCLHKVQASITILVGKDENFLSLLSEWKLLSLELVRQERSAVCGGAIVIWICHPLFRPLGLLVCAQRLIGGRGTATHGSNKDFVELFLIPPTVSNNVQRKHVRAA
jgi:hypothetical protein